MGQQISLNWPSNLMDDEAYTNALQANFNTIQNAMNANATQPSVLAFLQSATDNNNYTTNSATLVNIPNWSWTFTSQGGLVCISAILNVLYNNSNFGVVAMLIDQKIVLESTAHTAPGGNVSNNACLAFDWKAILGAGQHTVTFQFSTGGSGTFQINPSNSPASSAASIIEFPANVQDLNVTAA